ncbi:LLM class F420-dependent oxidoreductase [Kutzneria sp. CA-103260]|uniref:LLM class F420-dependent oxidoreductase n=1 Tax=Kutzneria sp. CA-103260 TaxID=2802641 RepID=UPI001BA8B9FD|nr:LLM class F420-dependent oxidoreductase [Kutzneria sp. CA-103260]
MSGPAGEGSGELKWGITLPLTGFSLREHRRLVEQLPEFGYTDVWTGEGTGVDAFTPLAVSSAWVPSLRLGTGVVPVHTRGPAVLAQTAATLAETTDASVLLGIGTSVPEHVTDINGIPYTKPYATVRDTLRFLTTAMRGEVVSGEFETFSVRRFQLAQPPVNPPKVILGALRPRMLALAFEEGDGAITNILRATDIPQVISAIGSPNHGKELVVKIFVCPTEDAEFARGAGRRFLAWILNRNVYKAFHEWLGNGQPLAETHAKWAAGDSLGAERALPEELVDELWIHGSPESCAKQIRQFVQPGVTAVLLYVASTPELRNDPGSLRDVLRTLGPAAR